MRPDPSPRHLSERNPFEPPHSDVVERGDRPRGSKALQISSAAVLLWIVVSPFMWWHNLSRKLGFEVDAGALVAPVALAVAAVLAAPFLPRGSRTGAIAVVGFAVAVVASMPWLPTPFSDGVIINAVLLAAIGLLSWRHGSGQDTVRRPAS